jgi:hypothetical protein
VTSGEQIGGKITQEREVSQATKSRGVVSQVEEKGTERERHGTRRERTRRERERRERVGRVINV